MSKFKITLLVFLSFWALSSSALSRHHSNSRRNYYDGMLRKGFHMGLQGAINSTWIIKQNNYNTLNLFYVPIVKQSEMDYVFTWGGQVGASIGYNFIKRFGIEFRPSFSWAGQKYDDNFTGPVASNGVEGAGGIYQPNTSIPNWQHYYSGTFAYVNVRRVVKFNYIQLPIFAKFQTRLGDIANYYVMAGPQINIRQSASENVWVNNYPYVYSGQLTPDERFQKVDIGIALNTGVDIFATDWMYVNVGLESFIALNDLNGSKLKQIGWYDKNHITYQQSHNFYLGLNAGVHFFLLRKNYY